MASSPPSPGQQIFPGHALIVEDNVIIALHVEALLEDFGVPQSIIAGTVEKALLVLDARDIAFAIVDVDLGTETSEDVAVALVARGLPFAFVTGFGQAADLPMRFPGVPLLMKPFAGGELRTILERLRLL